MTPRIMYIECKSGLSGGKARIGRVAFSKSGRTLHYRGQEFRSLKGAGFKANYYDVATGTGSQVRSGTDPIACTASAFPS